MSVASEHVSISKMLDTANVACRVLQCYEQVTAAIDTSQNESLSHEPRIDRLEVTNRSQWVIHLPPSPPDRLQR